MSCPFPGMDPFLEMQPYWSDFAPRLLTAMSNDLLRTLLPRYDVRIEEYLFVMHEEIRLHRVRPDVTISTTSASQPEAAATALADPVTSELEYPDIQPRTQRHLKLIHRPDERVVTIIELLSPTNKSPGEDGIDAYMEKRAEFVSSRVNLVEIDLLRGGTRLPMQGALPTGDYYVYVGRVGRRPRCQVFGWPLRMALPRIPIPLLPEDTEVQSDLAAVFHAAYDPSYYDQRLPYDQPLQPPLAPMDQQWTEQRLRDYKRT